jgi:hypothetical protein
MEDYTFQNLKKFPKDISRSLNCSHNKIRYIPNDLQLNTLNFMHNRVKRLPNLSPIKNITSADNKIKDRSRWISLHCFGNKYYSYLFKKLI